MSPIEIIDDVAGNIERVTLTQEQVQKLWDYNAALRADKERLDWLENEIHRLHYGSDCKVCVRGEDGQEFSAETWRQCIDAARAQGGTK